MYGERDQEYSIICGFFLFSSHSLVFLYVW